MSADEKTSEDARGRSGANFRTRPQEEPGTREQPACGSATGGHLRRYSHDVPARIAAFTVTHVTTQRWHGHSARARETGDVADCRGSSSASPADVKPSKPQSASERMRDRKADDHACARAHSSSARERR